MIGINADELLYVAGNLFRVYVIYRFFHLFFSKEPSGKGIECTAYLLFFAINTGVHLFFEMPFVNLAVNILGTFLITYLYRGKLRVRIIAVLIIISISLICEELVYRCMLFFNNQNNMAFGIATPAMMMLLVVVIFEKIYGFQNGEHLLPKQVAAILFVPILSIFILTVALQNKESDLMDALSAIGLVIMDILTIYLFNDLSETYESRNQLALEKQKTEAFEQQLQLMQDSEQSLSSLRHDMKNHLLALKSIAGEGGSGAVHDYIDSLMIGIHNPERFVETGNVLVDAILNLKLSEAAKIGARLRIDVNLPETFWISDIDANTILSNLMDNAVRAIKGCSDPYIDLEIRYEPGNLILRMSNPYAKTLLIENGEYRTTKAQKAGHGIGLRSVRRAVEKYNGVLQIDAEDKRFIVSVLLFEKANWA